MLRLSQRDIRQGYRGIKHLAKKEVKRGNYEMALSYIDKCAILAAQFNWIYSDDDLEYLLFQISYSTIITADVTYSADQNRWVLYDDFCLPFVLGIQWLRAMAESGKEILYITTRDISTPTRNKDILYVAAEYSNVKVEIIPQGDPIFRAQRIYDCILSFCPSKLVLHKTVNSPIQLTLCSLPKQIERYIINLSDQTFWLGSRSVDYVLEFRQFGVSVSQQRRGIKESQQLLVPFYPADDENEFQGFPKGCMNGNLIIFSGGDYYKTVDENRTYWHLVKALLDAHPNVNFLYAVKSNPEGDEEIINFISKNHYEDRFFFINFRPDIFQVFAHCDIYMGTCPTSGSLMSQLAAVNGKPILQYYSPGTPDDETEQAICFNNSLNISFDNIEDFLVEAGKLIENPEYRASQGGKIKEAMITPAQFNELVLKTIENNVSQIELLPYEINYAKSLDHRWYELEKQGYLKTLVFVYGILGKYYSLVFSPFVFIKHFLNRCIK